MTLKTDQYFRKMEDEDYVCCMHYCTVLIFSTVGTAVMTVVGREQKRKLSSWVMQYIHDMPAKIGWLNIKKGIIFDFKNKIGVTKHSYDVAQRVYDQQQKLLSTTLHQIKTL